MDLCEDNLAPLWHDPRHDQLSKGYIDNDGFSDKQTDLG